MEGFDIPEEVWRCYHIWIVGPSSADPWTPEKSVRFRKGRGEAAWGASRVRELIDDFPGAKSLVENIVVIGNRWQDGGVWSDRDVIELDCILV